MKNKFVYIIVFLGALYLITSIFASFFVSAVVGNVAVIPIKGVIITEGGGSDTISVEEVRDWIKVAEANVNVKAIIFEINSPGGSALAGKEMSELILKTNKTTVAVIRDVGASAGYMVAAACDYIIADEFSITGSIGATSSYLEIPGLLNKYNITYNRLVSKKYKDMGSPFKELTTDEEAKLQWQLDLVHDYFANFVAKNRKLTVDQVNSEEASFFLGIVAKEKGFIDEFGNIDEAKEYIKQIYNLESIDTFEFEKEYTIFDIISNKVGDFSFKFGQGFASGLTNNNYPKIS